jgi:hypothetical protein
MNMKKFYTVIILILAVIIFSPQFFPETTPGHFLKIETGAKSIAMGGAFVSIANDASAVYWNPAGIAKLQNNTATFTHTKWLADTDHNFAALIIKMGDMHSVGISYTSLTMPDMKVRNEYYQEGTGEYFSASDYSLGISYAINITKDFSMGFTAKYIGQTIWHMTASTVALDAGLLYNTPLPGLRVGMSVSNIGGKMKYDGRDNFIYYDYNSDEYGNNDKIFAEVKMDEWDLPLMFRAGLSMDVISTENHRLTISADAIHPNDYDESVNAGFEYGFNNRFFIRAGYKSLFKLESEEGLTAGLGLIYFLTDYMPLKVDYAYADFGRLEAVHRFSVEIGF